MTGNWRIAFVAMLAALPINSAAFGADRVLANTSSTLSNSATFAWIYLGKEKGFFKKRDIDLDIIEGQSGGASVQVVANGKADFGIGISASVVANARGQGAAIRMIGRSDPVSTIAVLSKKPNVLDTPQSLIGKTIGVPPGTSQAFAWPIFLKVNNLDPAKITVVNVPLAAMRTALLQNKLDGYLSYSSSQLPLLKAAGEMNAHALEFTDFGVRLAPENGIVAHEDTIKNKPDLVRRFMAAATESLQYMIDHPSEGAEAAKRADPIGVDVKVATDRIEYLALAFKQNVNAGHVLTWTPPGDWEKQVEVLSANGALINPSKSTDYFTNDFVPSN